MLTRVRAEVPGTVAGQLLVDLDALDVDGWLLQGAAACAAALPDLPSGLTQDSASSKETVPQRPYPATTKRWKWPVQGQTTASLPPGCTVARCT